MKPTFNKIVIFGVGLIGGSFALALRKANVVGVLVGFGRSETTLKQALELGIIDRIGADIATEVCDADLVLLTTPVGQMAELMSRIAPHLGSETLVTDGGSTKCGVVKDAYTHFGDKIAQYIPAHPIAGGEQSGATAARPDLYTGKKVVLTPLLENSPDSVAKVTKAWEACGAKVSELTPELHDEVFAAVSHLPHLLSYALVSELAQRDNRELYMSFAASGFRDFTRIAESSPEMWRDICLANREALLQELKLYMEELSQMSRDLEAGDASQLEKTFRAAQTLRAGWASKSGSSEKGS